jgi:hypothetical protein
MESLDSEPCLVLRKSVEAVPSHGKLPLISECYRALAVRSRLDKTTTSSERNLTSLKHSLHSHIMKDLSPSRNSSLRVFFARQIQQLIALCIIGGVLFISFHTFTKQPPQLLIESDKFPRKIWQSWKVDPTRFEHRDNERARTWTVKNPGHRYEVLTDDNADEW